MALFTCSTTFSCQYEVRFFVFACGSESLSWSEDPDSASVFKSFMNWLAFWRVTSTPFKHALLLSDGVSDGKFAEVESSLLLSELPALAAFSTLNTGLRNGGDFTELGDRERVSCLGNGEMVPARDVSGGVSGDTLPIGIL